MMFCIGKFLSLIYAFDSHSQGVERGLGGYKEGMSVRPAKTYVGGPAGVDGYMLDFFTG